MQGAWPKAMQSTLLVSVQLWMMEHGASCHLPAPSEVEVDTRLLLGCLLSVPDALMASIQQPQLTSAKQLVETYIITQQRSITEIV